jgi:hypothetical protein
MLSASPNKGVVYAADQWGRFRLLNASRHVNERRVLKKAVVAPGTAGLSATADIAGRDELILSRRDLTPGTVSRRRGALRLADENFLLAMSISANLVRHECGGRSRPS